jgi:NADH-quinone oxidoreductase subunit L
MWIPLAILAALSLVGGMLIKVPDFLHDFFQGVPEVPENSSLMIFSVTSGLIGIFIAWLLYVARPAMADSLASSFKLLYTTLYNKYFVDEIYDATVVNPLVGGSRWVLWKGADAGMIDGSVNGVGTLAQKAGGILRLLQSGNIRSYATWVLCGSLLAIGLIVFLNLLSTGGMQ